MNELNDCIVVAGHSHRVALVSAWNEVAPASRRPNTILIPKGETFAGPDYWQVVSKESQGRDVLVAWGGGQWSKFLFQVPAPFSVQPPGAPAIQDPHPRIAFERVVDHFFSELVPFLPKYFRLFKSARKVVFLGGPPPKSDDAIRRALVQKAEPAFTNVLERIGHSAKTVPLTPSHTRFALWRALQVAMDKHCRSAGIPYVEAPTTALDSSGVLRAELCSNDVIHGNSAFGALMWKELMPQFTRDERA